MSGCERREPSKFPLQFSVFRKYQRVKEVRLGRSDRVDSQNSVLKLKVLSTKLYLARLSAGSLGTSVFDAEVYLVGASGGVYALLAAHLANVLLNYNNMEFGIVRLIGIFVIGK